MIIESAKREPVLLVHYLGFDNEKDEVLFRNSPRLAKFGTYTARSDIPAYENTSEGTIEIKNQLESDIPTTSSPGQTITSRFFDQYE